MRRRTLLLSTTGFLALTAGCTTTGEEPDDETQDLPEEVTIEIGDGTFDPSVVHIAPGGSVTWENTGDESHRIDAFQFQAASTAWSYRERLEPGESVTRTFEDDGQFDYTDQAYGQFSMCGRIRVGDVEEGGPLPCE